MNPLQPIICLFCNKPTDSTHLVSIAYKMQCSHCQTLYYVYRFGNLDETSEVTYIKLNFKKFTVHVYPRFKCSLDIGPPDGSFEKIYLSLQDDEAIDFLQLKPQGMEDRFSKLINFV